MQLFTAIFFFIFFHLVFSIAGRFNHQVNYSSGNDPGSFLVLITSSKNEHLVFESARKTLQHQYQGKFDAGILNGFPDSSSPLIPNSAFYIIGSSTPLHPETMGAKNKAYDFVLLMDPGHVMEAGFLLFMNNALRQKKVIIQGQRKIKPGKDPITLLESLREEISNHIFRKGHRVLGFASRLSTGMAFHYDHFNSLMKQLNYSWTPPALEQKIFQAGINIEYLQEAILYDEKLTTPDHYCEQKCSWLASQYDFIRKYFVFGLKGLLTGNKNLWNQLVRAMSLPGSCVPFLLALFSLISFLQGAFINPLHWSMLMLFYLLSIWLTIPAGLLNKRSFQALMKLPVFGFCLWLSMFRHVMKEEKNEFYPQHLGSTIPTAC